MQAAKSRLHEALQDMQPGVINEEIARRKKKRNENGG
jgi:hypothetical protein